jgi:hypothetical protein
MTPGAKKDYVERDQVRLGRPELTNMTRKLVTIASALFGYTKNSSLDVRPLN